MSGSPKVARSRVYEVFWLAVLSPREDRGELLLRCRFRSHLPLPLTSWHWHVRPVVATTALLALIVCLVAASGSARAGSAPPSSTGLAPPVAVHPRTDPTISITANYDTIGAGLEDLVFTLTRTGSTDEV